MSSLDETFELLLQKLDHPDTLNAAKSDPIFYFVYKPEDMLTLKQRLSLWKAKLRDLKFDVERISLSDLLWQIVDESGRWEDWLEIEPSAEVEELNQAIRDVLTSQSRLIEEVAQRINSLMPPKIVFLTEVEMLHPYLRSRTLENKLHDRVPVPLIIFYPGYRAGQYGLRFLGFHAEDSNYRSIIVGGI
ncbi:BREX protein BrxB domain-containing protein [Nostoc sp.]|uniref:BREX protein BrxB domain-containing protein n=1 Tax=Nostoc sp. TaxID=1180 RepID=UPI002FF5BECE